VRRLKFFFAILLLVATPVLTGVACGNSDAEFGSYGETTSEMALGGLLDALK